MGGWLNDDEWDELRLKQHMTWDKDSKDVFFAFWEALPATIGGSTGKNAGHPADSNTEEKQEFNQSMMGYYIEWDIMEYIGI